MLGNLSIRAKLIAALLVLAAAGGFATWKAVELLQETRGQLAQVDRAVAELRGRTDGTTAAPPIERAVEAVRQTAIQAEIDLVVVGAIALVIAFVLALVFLLLAVALPIGRVTEAARNLAKGDLWTDLPDDARTDEAGGLAGALKSLKRAVIDQRTRADLAEQKNHESAENHAQAQHRDRLLAEEIKRIAEAARHDADQRIRALETGLREAADRHRGELQRQGEGISVRRERLAQMTLAFERSAFDARRSASSALDRLAGLADAVARAGSVAAGSHGASAQAIGATEQSLQAAGKRADALGLAIRGIVDRARGSAKNAAEALGQARTTDIEIQALAEAAQKIGEIVGVIQAIAQQTHLLALNASIEASRAGIAGKGFQVVAGEVKSLADQTARATDQVTRQIAGIQDRVARSVEAIRGIGDAVGKVALTVDGIAASVEQEGVAMVELGHHLDQAAAHSQAAGQALQPLGEAATALTKSTCALQEAATVIAERLSSIEGDIARYLEAVRDI